MHQLIFAFLLSTLEAGAPGSGISWTKVDTNPVDIPAFLQKVSDEETVVLYVGAKWCEPCVRFKRAVQAGKLNALLDGVHFVEFDLDRQRSSLEVAGYQSRMIPLFCLPDGETGQNSGNCISGSVKGPGAIGNLVPRLQTMLGRGNGSGPR